MTPKDAARDLVVRARQGDQNAMAIIVQVRERSKRGVKKAQTAFGLIRSYIDAHPAPKSSGMGAERQRPNPPRPVLQRIVSLDDALIIGGLSRVWKYQDGALTASVLLANGPPLTRRRTRELAASFGNETAEDLFLWGVDNPESLSKIMRKKKLPPAAVGCLFAGQCVGMARRIQAIRIPGVSAGVLSPMVAWELGE